MHKEIKGCRICGNRDLAPVLNLGNQYMTGVFPRKKSDKIAYGPLELVKCREDENSDFCGLLQLKQTYDLREMYGANYGYRSGLNQVMVRHLEGKIKDILSLVKVSAGDIVVDIGSNDATLLKAYPEKGLVLAGIDPAGDKFKKYYPSRIQLIPQFFSGDLFKKRFGSKKAKIITSIAMFYDIEEPLSFMADIHDILADDGVWIFEQSYMPEMLNKNAYDTICHEHLEYYGLRQIKWMTDKAGFKIIDVEFNDINGGSFSVTVSKKEAPYDENIRLVRKIISEEEKNGLNTLKPYEDFRGRVFLHKKEMLAFFSSAKKNHKKIFGYGASTKGNVILQFCNLTEKDIPFIAEVNEDKFGCHTPGTRIPIIPEKEARVMRPDYFLIFPWHFKDAFIEKEEEYLEKGGRLLIPLPAPEVISGRCPA